MILQRQAEKKKRTGDIFLQELGVFQLLNSIKRGSLIKCIISLVETYLGSLLVSKSEQNALAARESCLSIRRTRLS